MAIDLLPSPRMELTFASIAEEAEIALAVESTVTCHTLPVAAARIVNAWIRYGEW